MELLGQHARTIEVWAYNPTIEADVGNEPMVAWGHRGGPAGTNLQFGFGDDPTWGAVSHWNPDLGWYLDPPPEGNHPPLAQWAHLVYSFEPAFGGVIRIYVNGEETNTQLGAIATDPGHINLGAPNDTSAPMDLSGFPRATLSLAAVRVHDGALTPEQVAMNFRRGIARPLIAADMDADGDVDLADFLAFQSCAQGPFVPVMGPPPCDQADLDGDGDADQNDFSILQRCYSGDGVAADPACR